MQSDTNEFNLEEENEYYSTKQKTNEIFDKYLDSITNEKQLLLIKQIVNLLNDPRDEIKEMGKEYFKSLEQRVKPKTQYQNFQEDHKKSLLREHFQPKKDVGASILLNDGSFILTDEQTRKTLEWKHSPAIKKTLQDFCATAGETNLYKHIQSKNQLLDSNQNEYKFKMTIYSETTRKKGMKQLKNMYDKILKNKIKEHSITDCLKEIKDFDGYDKIRIKFLKTISIKLKKEKVSRRELQDLMQEFPGVLSSPPLKDMAKNPAVKEDVLICEITQNATVEKIDNEDIIKDTKLALQERKWQEKILLLRNQKIEKQQEQNQLQPQRQDIQMDGFQQDPEGYTIECN